MVALRFEIYNWQVNDSKGYIPKRIYVTLFWKTDHAVTFSISRNTDFKY